MFQPLLKQMTVMAGDLAQFSPSPSPRPAPCHFKLAHKLQQKYEGSGKFQQPTLHQTQNTAKVFIQITCNLKAQVRGGKKKSLQDNIKRSEL